MLAVRLPDDIQARLTQLAERTGRSTSDCVREALLAYLDDMEDVYLAEHELEKIRSGQSSTVPLKDVLKQYGVED